MYVCSPVSNVWLVFAWTGRCELVWCSDLPAWLKAADAMMGVCFKRSRLHWNSSLWTRECRWEGWSKRCHIPANPRNKGLRCCTDREFVYALNDDNAGKIFHFWSLMLSSLILWGLQVNLQFDLVPATSAVPTRSKQNVALWCTLTLVQNLYTSGTLIIPVKLQHEWHYFCTCLSVCTDTRRIFFTHAQQLKSLSLSLPNFFPLNSVISSQKYYDYYIELGEDVLNPCWWALRVVCLKCVIECALSEWKSSWRKPGLLSW